MQLATILLSFLFLFQAPYAEAKALPKGLAAFLERMGIPRVDFLRSYQAYRNRLSANKQYDYKTRSQVSREDLTTSQQISHVRISTMSDETTRSQASSDVPEHSEGVNTTKLNNVPYIPADAHCAPRPTTIEIPKIFGVTIFPSYVVLHRCSGSCSLQEAQHCAVTAQDAIEVLIVEVVGNSHTISHRKLYDHTACGCDCIQTASQCDAQKQTWNKDYCTCDCIEDGSQCDSATQSWDSDTCACECKMAPQICDNNKEWDTENCGCHCKKSLQDQCAAQNQPIDTATCQCVDVNAL